MIKDAKHGWVKSSLVYLHMLVLAQPAARFFIQTAKYLNK